MDLGDRLVSCRAVVKGARFFESAFRSLEPVHVFARGRRRVATVRAVRVIMDFSDPKRLTARELPATPRKHLERATR
jgi:hypothetical protein